MNIIYDQLTVTDKEQYMTLGIGLSKDSNDNFTCALNNPGKTFVARINNCIVGACSAYIPGPYHLDITYLDTAWITSWKVLKHYRNKGIGSTLVKLCVNNIENNVSSITIMTPFSNHKLLKNLGFINSNNYGELQYKK